MPRVDLELDINAPVERVWRAVTDVERYPESMDSVRSVTIVDADGPTVRRTAWSVLLKGSILQWEEVETLDPDERVMSSQQVSGDMEKFEATWSLQPIDADRTTVSLAVDFEIGIPLLADMLDPVAQRALRENCTEMLRGVEQESLEASAWDAP
jgi:ribosome-associated toxin RatA of RatAB toxin-antitoxin module